MTATEPCTELPTKLAAFRDQIAGLDARESIYHSTVSALLAEITSLLIDLSRSVRAQTIPAGLTEDPPGTEGGRYLPDPAPVWRDLPPADRQEPVASLRTWVERVYLPGYGHLAAGLGSCWASHDLCLYVLDILAQTWEALYLRPDRSERTLSAQAEFQARILAALAAQLRAETQRCGHSHNPAPVSGPRRSTP